jgi:uncharacterized protein YbcV (DUF1398 family)
MSLGAAILATIGADTTDLQRGAGQVENIAGRMNKALSAVGLGLSVGAAVAFTKAIVEQFGRMADLAAQTGLTTDAIQTFSYAAKQAGIDEQVIINSTQKLRINMGELALGSESVAKSLDVLKISGQAILALSLDQQFEAVARAYIAAEDKQKAFAATADLLGTRNMPKLMEIIEQLGKEGLPAMTASASRAGQVLDQEFVGAIDRAGDRASAFWNSIKVGAGTVLGALLLAPEHLGKLVGGLAYGSDAVFETWKKTTGEIDRSGEAATRLTEIEDAYNAERIKQQAERERNARLLAEYDKQVNENGRKELALAEEQDRLYLEEQKKGLDALNQKKAALVAAAKEQHAAEAAIADQIARQVKFEETLGTMKAAAFDKGAMKLLGGERTYNDSGQQVSYEKALREQTLRQIDFQIDEVNARIQRLQSYAGSGARTGVYQLPELQSQLRALQDRERNVDRFLFDPKYSDALGRSVPGQQIAALNGEQEDLLRRTADGIAELAAGQSRGFDNLAQSLKDRPRG